MKHLLNFLNFEERRTHGSKKRVWYYQWPNGTQQRIRKNNYRWWYSDENNVTIGCDTLNGAKGDIIYGGGKVWSELI